MNGIQELQNNVHSNSKTKAKNSFIGFLAHSSEYNALDQENKCAHLIPGEHRRVSQESDFACFENHMHEGHHGHVDLEKLPEAEGSAKAMSLCFCMEGYNPSSSRGHGPLGLFVELEMPHTW